jgi:hypothetical protein
LLGCQDRSRNESVAVDRFADAAGDCAARALVAFAAGGLLAALRVTALPELTNGVGNRATQVNHEG